MSEEKYIGLSLNERYVEQLEAKVERLERAAQAVCDLYDHQPYNHEVNALKAALEGKQYE